MMLRAALLAASMLTGAGSSLRCIAAEVDVYILAGQSNAGGHGYVSKASAYYSEFKDPGLVEIGQEQWTAVQPDAQVFTWFGTTPTKARPMFWERRSAGWVPMRGGIDTVDSGGKTMKFTPFGVEVSFASQVAKHRPGRRLAVIKYTQGATSIKTDWDPVAGRSYDVLNPVAAGHCYAGLFAATKEALAALREADQTPTLRGILWIQGESDAGMNPDEYARKLSELAKSMRADLGAQHAPFAVGELLQINPNFQVLRRAQAEYARTDPDAILISSEGLTADHTWGGKLHIDTRSILEFGLRFADQMAPLQSEPASRPAQVSP